VTSNGHHLQDGQLVVATPILAGRHHEYRLETALERRHHDIADDNHVRMNQ